MGVANDLPSPRKSMFCDDRNDHRKVECVSTKGKSPHFYKIKKSSRTQFRSLKRGRVRESPDYGNPYFSRSNLGASRSNYYMSCRNLHKSFMHVFCVRHSYFDVLFYTSSKNKYVTHSSPTEPFTSTISE